MALKESLSLFVSAAFSMKCYDCQTDLLSLIKNPATPQSPCSNITDSPGSDACMSVHAEIEYTKTLPGKSPQVFHVAFFRGKSINVINCPSAKQSACHNLTRVLAGLSSFSQGRLNFSVISCTADYCQENTCNTSIQPSPATPKSTDMLIALQTAAVTENKTRKPSPSATERTATSNVPSTVAKAAPFDVALGQCFICTVSFMITVFLTE